MDRGVAPMLPALHEVRRGLSFNAVGGVEGKRFPRCDERRLIYDAKLAGDALALSAIPSRNPLHLR